MVLVGAGCDVFYPGVDLMMIEGGNVGGMRAGNGNGVVGVIDLRLVVQFYIYNFIAGAGANLDPNVDVDVYVNADT